MSGGRPARGESTSTWMTSRPGMLRSCRWRSVRLIPGGCAKRRLRGSAKWGRERLATPATRCASCRSSLDQRAGAPGRCYRPFGSCSWLVSEFDRVAFRVPSRGLAQRSERGPELGREELRLLPRREVAALVDLVEVDQVAIGAPGPCLRGAIDLPRKDRDGDRERDLGGLLRGRTGDAASAVSPSTAAPTRSRCSSASTA